LWTIGSIPFATSVIMTLPVLLAASALQEAAHAGGPDAHVHIAQASHLRNIAGGAIILGAILSWFTVAVLCRDIVTVVTDVIKAAYNIIEGKLDTPTPHRNRNDEYGQIACAFDALRERSKTIKELEDQRWTVAAAREEERTRLVAAFERSLGDVVTSVASAASQLPSTKPRPELQPRPPPAMNSPCRSARSAGRPAAAPNSPARPARRRPAQMGRFPSSPLRRERSVKSWD
jgi:hypothetical protein